MATQAIKPLLQEPPLSASGIQPVQRGAFIMWEYGLVAAKGNVKSSLCQCQRDIKLHTFLCACSFMLHVDAKSMSTHQCKKSESQLYLNPEAFSHFYKH